MEIQVTQEDLKKCFKFAVEYHLDETKLAANRTTGQYRGLGGIIDSFVIGKLIELGVARIIEQNTNKKCILDFDMHENLNEHINDPDIIKIEEDGEERDPRLFIEIKNISPDDRWIGLTAEQFRTILTDDMAGENPENVILIYASLISKNSEKDIDPLGVYLKSCIEQDLLDDFCQVEDLYIKIQYISTGAELQEKGVEFNVGSFLYETDIFEEASGLTSRQVKDPEKRDKFVPQELEPNKFPVIMRNMKDPPEEFGEFTFTGVIEVFKKTNEKSQRMYVHCIEDVKIKNFVLGVFNLEAGKVYETYFETVGMNPTLKRNNIWIAQRNLSNVISMTPEEKIKEIKENI